VKAVGAGHSFTGAALTDGRLLRLDRYKRILRTDSERRTVTVQAGISIAELNRELDALGLALPNLGDIDRQSISGAIATSTHGTGASFRSIAQQVIGMRMVVGDGSVVECSQEAESEPLRTARVGVGALGLVSTVTLQCVPAFTLRAIEQPMRLDEVLEALDELVDANEHFEFYYVPHTRWCFTKQNNRDAGTPAPRARWREFFDDVVVQNLAFGALCHIAKLRPSLIPRLAKAIPSSVRTEYTDKSFKVFTSPRWVPFYEMEYAIPREAAIEALTRVRSLIDTSGLLTIFPIEVRFLAGDDIPLSTAYGRDTCYIAVHVYQGMHYQQYFKGFEEIMNDYDGRPHWGKLHFQTGASLAPRYPEWDTFQRVRSRLDPEGRFSNDYTERVLGAVNLAAS
jgi:L-gulonolactone oxidase